MMRTPPKAKKIPHKITQHGQTRVDNYAWLRDDNWRDFLDGKIEFKNPEIKKYIEEENTYTKNIMEPTKEMQKTLYEEILGRIKEDDQSYPFKKGNYYYYHREEKGKNYPLLCRKDHPETGKEQIYLDVNKEAKNHKLFILGKNTPSPDNNFLAYMFNTTGSMERTLKVRNLKTGEDYPWEIEDTNGSFSWKEGSEHLFYVERDRENGRGKKVYLINIHQGPKSANLIFEKPAELDHMFMSVGTTTSKRFLDIFLTSSSSSVTYLMDLKEDSPVPTLVSPLKQGIEYLVEHSGDNLYMLTNLGGAQNFKILRSNNLELENLVWEDFIPEKDSVFIDNFSIYNDFMILETRNNELALPQLQIHNIKTRDNKIVKMDKQAYSLNFKGADDFNETKVRFYYQSPKGPLKTMDLDLKTGEQIVRKTQEVPNFDEGNYEVKRVYAPAHDGEEIPLTLLYKKGTPLNGSAPAYVYSYGSYGYSLPTNFSQPVLSLVDKGFIHVIAHIRGGSDKGYGWYLDGKMKNKLNTFKDFISSCEYLIKKKYTSLGNIVAHGGSAGGLLMGVVANMRPDLFKAVVADVPFVDMINTISDASLPLTPPEWEEWGNPIKNKDEFEYMMGYSPYDNIATQRYPNMLFNSGISDEQVTYWEPTKMVAKLRELKTDENLTLLNIKMHEGHSGASKRYEWIKEKAFTYAFILKCFD